MFLEFVLPAFGQEFNLQLAYAAETLTKDHVTYDPSYFSIAYPNGDIPADKGVCTDVIIRAYRKLNIDLQEKVHLDMKTYFAEYPKIWGLKRPDSNIDHRRVPNLMTFFQRHGRVLPNSTHASDYKPGDIVCWQLSNNLLHIGMVSCRRSEANGSPLIVHNIGGGQVLEDCLFNWTIIGHYRFKSE